MFLIFILYQIVLHRNNPMFHDTDVCQITDEITLYIDISIPKYVSEISV